MVIIILINGNGFRTLLQVGWREIRTREARKIFLSSLLKMPALAPLNYWFIILCVFSENLGFQNSPIPSPRASAPARIHNNDFSEIEYLLLLILIRHLRLRIEKYLNHAKLVITKSSEWRTSSDKRKVLRKRSYSCITLRVIYNVGMRLLNRDQRQVISQYSANNLFSIIEIFNFITVLSKL